MLCIPGLGAVRGAEAPCPPGEFKRFHPESRLSVCNRSNPPGAVPVTIFLNLDPVGLIALHLWYNVRSKSKKHKI